MKSTIKIYEKANTEDLQYLLKKLERCLEYAEIVDDKDKINDYEIDIHLIRMELNKRLWKEKK